jgi:hypothetical protein
VYVASPTRMTARTAMMISSRFVVISFLSSFRCE